jgi:hypothetical protein
MAEQTEVYDLLILVDATYSMSSYLTSLQTSLPKIISISALTDSFSRVGLLAYRDYCDAELLHWSGWMQQSKTGAEDEDQQPSVDLVEAAKALYANGGGDYPEATKTGLARAYQIMREDATTIILLYTDAPPHTAANGNSHGYNNFAKEKKALQDPKSYGGFGPAFVDWVHGGRTMALKEKGKKRAHVFSILEPSMARADGNYYTFLSTLTGGACFYLESSEPKDISKVTVDLLLAWMGVEKTGAEATKIAARLAKFKNPARIGEVKKESTKESLKGSGNVEELLVDSAVLKNFMPKKKTPVQDFARRYKTDDAYKLLVAQHLQKIIAEDVSAISLNPVFGSLWRAVCNDRANENREALISSFGLQVDRIANPDEKELMKNWLAESYDYSAEVQETIELVPEAQRFPCVYLDPTLAFIRPSGADAAADDDEDDRPIAEFRRDELLEIGRSCDQRVLRRLGRVLTRLTFIDSAAELPAHIANAEEGKAQRIPMALASKEFGHRFWRILLHIVVPGTMLSARPAALLAALAIRLGIQPLLKAADTEMLMWRNKWNDLEVPETWNASCLGLLLDADKAYLDRQRLEKAENGKAVKGLLTTTDKQLFDRVVSYKMLELNLKTTLTAKVGWKPEKTTMPIGPVVVCRSCQYPRSVTIMGPKDTCGICLATDYQNDKERQECIDGRVTKQDNETSNATWVECFVRTCRAQYIVYHPDALNVRAKCHYCRQQSFESAKKRSNKPQPWLECVQCLSRVIIPMEYRTKDMAHFKCVACDSERKTIIEVETTAQDLSKENETTWLLENKQGKLKEPLSGRSLFHQITSAGSQGFCDQVILFPNAEHQALTLDGKLIRNTPDLIAQLKTWVSRRQRELGTCSLCFSNFRKVDLNPACGRHGCEQRICRDCLGGWYGLNAAGRIINTAALSCPFCRRAPTAKTLHSYGLGIHAVSGLREAVANAGEWVYAWCARCANARQYLERVCAAGAPMELNDWICGVCETELTEAAERELAALQAELAGLGLQYRRAGYERRAEVERAIEAARRLKAARKYKEEIKECPQCEVKTQKLNGCGHMACICGTHWCWFCGEKSSPADIYSHMQTEHDGWFAAEDVEIDEDYEGTSDED